MTAPPIPAPLHAYLERLQAIRSGLHPSLIAKLDSGWVILGDSQFLPGYCLLIADPVVATLNELRGPARQHFLQDVARVGDAVLQVTAALRINYQILGNLCPALHAHIIPRYSWEEPSNLTSPNALYFQTSPPRFDQQQHADLLLRLAAALKAAG
jgi:diadenosine tetraphosphate (Ap4A) HIT family hydrolase